jgi:hypothetical protein
VLIAADATAPPAAKVAAANAPLDRAWGGRCSPWRRPGGVSLLDLVLGAMKQPAAATAAG